MSSQTSSRPSTAEESEYNIYGKKINKEAERLYSKKIEYQIQNDPSAKALHNEYRQQLATG